MRQKVNTINTIFKTTLVLLVVLFGELLFVLPANATTDDGLVVEYKTETGLWKQWLSGEESFPIFTEENFLPGDSVSRLIRVTNNSSGSQNIAIEAINWSGFPNPDDIPDKDLSRALSIIIRGKDGNDLYGGTTGEKTLYNFYRKDDFNATYEHILTYDLPGNGASTTYEFLITFPYEKGNDWQGATTTFDILIGFQGKEGGEPLPPPSGGPGLPPGLRILEGSATTTKITTTSATIIWTTSYFSTSQVIYDTVPGKFNLTAGPPNYGYTLSKEGDDSQKPKVTGHSVTIKGLTSGMTYYYRCVSHGSLAISQEHSFTTLRVKCEREEDREEEAETEAEEAEVAPTQEGTLPEKVVLVPIKEETKKLPKKETIEEEKGIVSPGEIQESSLVEEGFLEEIFGKEGLLAAIGAMPFNLKLILIIAEIIIVGLIILWLIRKKKIKS